MMDIVIRKASISDAEEISMIVATSNKEVAEMFNININNNPRHPSFYNKEWVISDFERGKEYFIYKIGNTNVGCVAFEHPNKNTGYLNRLSVLPENRNRGIGETLVKHVFNHAKFKGVSEISIGIIAQHTLLKKWYLRLGFIENGIKEFPHLPFKVLYMRYNLTN
ncbi:MAG: GNAT family N-acetyltransferase [Candidatus Sedimenticola sp. (ex Thyasira tokunagai)]